MLMKFSGAVQHSIKAESRGHNFPDSAEIHNWNNPWCASRLLLCTLDFPDSFPSSTAGRNKTDNSILSPHDDRENMHNLYSQKSGVNSWKNLPLHLK